MAKDIDDLIKKMPADKRAAFESARDGLKEKGAELKPSNYDPHALAPQGQPRPYAQEPKPGLGTDTQQRQPNEVDKMLSVRNQAAAKDTGKELTQQQVKQKDQDLER